MIKKFVKSFLIRPYDVWAAIVVLDRKMIKFLSDYHRLSKTEVIYMLKLAIKLDAFLWNALNPKTEQEIENFYKITPFNVFTLAYWHMSNYQKRFRRRTLNLCKGSVLDFGGGIGDMCISLKDRKFENVTYSEVEGKTFEFANYLFQKSNYKIPVINLSKEKVKGNYDTILCIDVIEHVVDQKETLKVLVDHLNKDGVLIITALNHMGGSENDPWHFKGSDNIDEYLNSIGMVKSKDNGILWTKIV
jgi:SAM-dependent methyltransferase